MTKSGRPRSQPTSKPLARSPPAEKRHAANQCAQCQHKREQEKRRNELVLNHRGRRPHDDNTHEADPHQESDRQPTQWLAPDVHTFGGNAKDKPRGQQGTCRKCREVIVDQLRAETLQQQERPNHPTEQKAQIRIGLAALPGTEKPAGTSADHG